MCRSLFLSLSGVRGLLACKPCLAQLAVRHERGHTAGKQPLNPVYIPSSDFCRDNDFVADTLCAKHTESVADVSIVTHSSCSSGRQDAPLQWLPHQAVTTDMQECRQWCWEQDPLGWVEEQVLRVVAPTDATGSLANRACATVGTKGALRGSLEGRS